MRSLQSMACWPLLLLASVLQADEGEPIALRAWPNNTFSIESHWGLKVAFGERSKQLSQSQSDLRPLELGTSLHHQLWRSPNETKSGWAPIDESNSRESTFKSSNAIHVRQNSEICVVHLDGVTIALATRLPDKAESSETHDKEFGNFDVVVLAMTEFESLDESALSAWIKDSKPKLVVAANVKLLAILEKLKTTWSDSKLVRQNHNTIAVSSTMNFESPRLVMLKTKVWEMPDELAKRFEAMDTACTNSQAVFSKLSVEQLNFQPSNGTHTPRWNCEHMMGRQLLFFSQIYHKLDPTIRVMNLNPAQMPPDYKFAHPEWDGVEEAKQMQRVADFTRRFAYLLEGQPLDKRAPGSSWPSLRALINQMERHYNEHTANTKKKFDLADFPK